MPEPQIVVPTYLRQPKDLQVTLTMLESLRASAPNAEVLVVDDCSPAPQLVDEIDAARSRLSFDLARLPTNEGFSRTVNVGLRKALAEGRDAVLVNADIEFIDEDWLPAMQADPASVVGGLLLYPNGLIQHAGIFFSLLHRTFGHVYQYGPGDLPAAQGRRKCPVTGALQFIAHGLLDEIGLYDEDFRMGYEDVDFCVRAFEAGAECAYVPEVRAVHYESLFRGVPGKKLERWQNESWWTFMKKYRDTNFAQYLPSTF